MILFLFLSALQLLLPCAIFAVEQPAIEQFYFDQLSVNDGLSQNCVYDIHQDQYGFMWFATDDGLNMYNGYDFEVYAYDPDDSTSVSDNSIRVIYEDAQKNLWFGGLALNYFCRCTQTFHRFYLSNDLPYDHISAICQDTDSTLWIGTEGAGLFRVHHTHTSFSSRFLRADSQRCESIFTLLQHFTDDSSNHFSIKSNYITSIILDKNETLWIGTKGGLSRLELDGTFLYDSLQVLNRTFVDIHFGDELKSSPICNLYIDSDSLVWLATPIGVNKYDPAHADSLTHYPLQLPNIEPRWKRRVSSMHDDQKGTLWIGSQIALYLLDKKTGKSRIVRTNYNAPSKIFSGKILSIYQDRSNIIWLGSQEHGLYKHRENANFFSRYLESDHSRPPTSINGVVEDNAGLLWAITHNQSQIYRVDRRTNSIRRIELPGGPYAFQSLVKDTSGQLWLSSGNHIFIFDPETERVTKHYLRHAQGGLYKNFPFFHLYSHENFVWFMDGDMTDVGRFNINTKVEHIFKIATQRRGEVTTLLTTADGQLWIGCETGLLNFHPVTSQFIDDFSVNHNKTLHILTIQADPQNRDVLIIGTKGNGLFFYNTKTNSFRCFTQRDGLPNNTINAIIPGENNTMWLSTNAGLSFFDVGGTQFTNYNIHDGLPSQEFNRNAALKNTKGDIVFGSINGLVTFHPGKRQKPNTPPPHVILHQLGTNHRLLSHKTDKELLPAPFYTLDNIKLNFNQRDFSIFCFLVDYADPSKNRYSYMLEGFHTDWSPPLPSRRFHFSNVPAGEHKLLVRGVNADGVWSDPPTTLTITITRPWWRQTWTIVLWIVLYILLLWGIHVVFSSRYKLAIQVKQEKREVENLRQIDKLKSRFFDYISHEFRTPLTMIIGPIDELADSNTDKYQKQKINLIKSNAQMLLNLVNQILELSKIDAQNYAIHLSYGDLAQHIRDTVALFSAHAEQKELTMSFNADPDTMNTFFDADVLTKIIYNLLSNAVKFTDPNGHISVTLSLVKTKEKTQNIKLDVSDTGIGIQEKDMPHIFDRFTHARKDDNCDYTGIGLGLALVKELVRLHQGHIDVQSVENEGTTFSVILPDLYSNFKAGHSLDVLANLTNEMAHVASKELLSIPAPIEKRESETDKAPPTPAHAKVLVIEDDDNLRSYLSDLLGMEFTVMQTRDGQQGLDIAFEMQPDLVICDIKMPNKNGFQVTQELKHNTATSHIPIILLTGSNDDASIKKGWEIGADAYIVKPFKATELTFRIKNLLAQRIKLKKTFATSLALKPETIADTPANQQFLQDVLRIIEEHLDDENFGVDVLARQIGLSTSQLARRLNKLLNKSTVKVIQSVRLERARQLLQNDSCSISEIAYRVGFNNPSYFTKVFHKEFACTPQEFVNKHKSNSNASIALRK